MSIRLEFVRNLENETIDVSLTPEVTEDTCPVEKAWGKTGLGYAQKVAEQHTFELNPMRDDKPCYIDIRSHEGNAVSLDYKTPESGDVIGGMSSSTRAMSSIVFSMMQEALEYNSQPVDEDEDEDEEDFIDDEDDDDHVSDRWY